MKKIEAIIRPFKLDEVREELQRIGITGLTITEVKGFGHQKARAEMFRGAEVRAETLPKFKIEILGSDEMTDTVIETILAVAKTGQVGDGKIIVSPVERIIRIRSSEEGGDAL